MTMFTALEKGDVHKAWAVFDKTYTSRDCKALTEPSLTDVPLLGNGYIFLLLLQAINKMFYKGLNVPVTPTQLLFRYEQLGIARADWWNREAFSWMTHKVIESIHGISEQGQPTLPVLLHELISAWRLFFQCKGNNNDPLQSISTEWHLPTIESVSEDVTTKNFGLRLQKFHPRFVGKPVLNFCAVYLYTISDAIKSVESLQQEAMPFLQLLERLLAGSHIHSISTHTEHSRMFIALPQHVQLQVIQDIDAAPRRAMTMLGESGETLDKTEDEAANLETFYLKRIVRAVESTSSASNLEYVWKQAIYSYTSPNGKIAIPLLIYNAFLSGFMVLLKPSRTVDIWNHMIAHGVQPTARTWVALLNGCIKSKDLHGLNQMWQRMLNSGIEPDVYLWTERVNGLMSLRKVNRALLALDEMGKKWLAAEKMAATGNDRGNGKGAMKTKSANTATKPTVEVVNGAITALVQIRAESMTHSKKVEFAQKILGWADSFNIHPDVRTYNSIIRLYLQAGDYTTAFKVLRKMEVSGIPGDIATHTMIVTAAFDNETFRHLPPSEQKSRVLLHLDSVEQSGVRLNDHIYTTAIDRLLKQSSNVEAAKAVIEHMRARNRVPGAAIYTSLASHYFQQEPADIQAVDGLVHQIFTSHRVPSDGILFDRLIEGYALHGEVGKMMSVLARMSQHGTPTGWRTLSAVVSALVEHGDYERARHVVSDVVRVEGVAQGGVLGSRSGEQNFFALVKSLGLEVEEKMLEGGGDAAESMRRVKSKIDTGMLVQSPEEMQQHQSQAHAPSLQRHTQPISPDDEDVHGFLTNEQEHP